MMAISISLSPESFTTVFRGDGKGGFTQGESYAARGIPLVGDLNGNGRPDLLLATGKPRLAQASTCSMEIANARSRECLPYR